VSENVPHCTLLYGLLRPGPELRKHVDTVLKGWEAKDVTVAGVAIFETSKDDVDCVCIVAQLEITDELVEANARLRLLPHIDTHAEYLPHITLAYLKADCDWQAYVRPLSDRLRGMSVNAVGVNYGD
jgi:2'-5' RNA ligase